MAQIAGFRYAGDDLGLLEGSKVVVLHRHGGNLHVRIALFHSSEFFGGRIQMRAGQKQYLHHVQNVVPPRNKSKCVTRRKHNHDNRSIRSDINVLYAS